MGARFRFLEQLERDLQDAAAREHLMEAAPSRRLRVLRTAPGGHGRRANWGTVAAGLVIVLVVAGAIGGLAQLGRNAVSPSASVGLSEGGASDLSSSGADEGGAQPAAGEPEEALAAGLTDRARRDVAEFSAAQEGAGGQGSGAAADPGLRQDLSKVVRDGTIALVVAGGGFGEAFDRTTAIAEDAGGFVLSSSITQENQGTLTLRVPSKKLDGAVVRLRELGRLTELTLSGEDVTADFIDLKARLQVLQTQRELIVELLNESTSVGGSLSLSNRFADVQTQIEQIQGSLNVLNDQVDLATLKVSLREEGVAVVPDEGDIRNPSLGSAWDRAVQGFFGVIGAVVVGLGYLLPVLAIGGAALAVRLAFRRRRAAS